MIADIMSPACWQSYNIKQARLFGLDTAVYLSVLIDIVPKAIRKKKVDENGMISLDRDYIASRTMLKEQEQLSCDTVLEKAGIIGKNESEPDRITMNIQKLAAVTSEDDIDAIISLQKSFGVKKKMPRAFYVKNALNAVVTENVEDERLQKALKDWVESCMAHKPLTTAVCTDFVTGLLGMEYSEEDKVKIVRIAAANAWTVLDWAVNSFRRTEKQQKQGGFNFVKPAAEKKQDSGPIDASQLGQGF